MATDRLRRDGCMRYRIRIGPDSAYFNFYTRFVSATGAASDWIRRPNALCRGSFHGV